MFITDSSQGAKFHGTEGPDPGPPDPSPCVLFKFCGHDIEYDLDESVSLSELWELAGSPPGLDPWEWMRGGGSALAAHLTSIFRPDFRVMEIGWDRDGVEVRARRELAVYYAQHLSPEFAFKVVDAFDEWTDEEVFPENPIERAIEGYLEGGDDEASIEETLKDLLRGCVARYEEEKSLGSGIGFERDAPDDKPHLRITPIDGRPD